MQIHFVAYQIEISQMCWTDRGASSLEEVHDPMAGFADFANFFHEIDGAGSEVAILRIKSEQMRKAFWHRDDFLAMLRETCQGDVYIQSCNWYEVKLCFVHAADLQAVEARLDKPKSEALIFPDEKRAEIQDFLFEMGDRIKRDYEIESLPGGSITFRFRDPSVEMLVKTKFRFT
jgi:hypothetical protein